MISSMWGSFFAVKFDGINSKIEGCFYEHFDYVRLRYVRFSVLFMQWILTANQAFFPKKEKE